MSLFAIAARFVFINQPYIDKWSWRQSDVAAIARNYFEGGYHFSRPQIDWAGDQPGYVGTEFPILPFLAALSYKIFGVHQWIGRIQALILFAVSLPFFFLLVRKSFGDSAANWALFFYSFAPLGVMASRCFMPDMPSLALSIVGLYFFDHWLEGAGSIRRRQNASPARTFGGQAFFASALCISLALLIKATSIIIAAPLWFLVFQRFGFAALKNLRLWLFAAIALIPASLWYWHAYRISEQFYPHHFFGAGGVRIMPVAWYLKIAGLIVTSTLTPLLFVIGVIGAFPAGMRPRARVFHWWLAATIFFIIAVGYGNRHQWYQLPLVPIFAAFAGGECALIATKIPNRSIQVTLAVLLVISFGVVSVLYAGRFYDQAAAPLREAGLELNEITDPSLVAAADNGDPTLLYYAQRKGWHFLEKDGIYEGDPKDSAQLIMDLDHLRAKGARYLVFTSNTAWWLDYYSEFRHHLHATSALITATPEFSIYRLESSPNE